MLWFVGYDPRFYSLGFVGPKRFPGLSRKGPLGHQFQGRKRPKNAQNRSRIFFLISIIR